MRACYFKILICLGLLFASSAYAAAVTINQYIGNWIKTATYAAGNVVTYNNQTYLALLPVPVNITPNNHPGRWKLLAITADSDIAKAGDACTLAGSDVINNGSLVSRTLGGISRLVCEEPNVWNFQKDMRIGITSGSQYRNWTLMYTPVVVAVAPNPPDYQSNTFTQLSTFGQCSYASTGNTPIYVVNYGCWSNGLTGDGAIGIASAGSPIRSSNTSQGPAEHDLIVLNPSVANSSVIRWTSPFTGTVAYNFTNYGVYIGGSGTSYWVVLHNGGVVVTKKDVSDTLPLIINVSAGDTLDFLAERTVNTNLIGADIVITKQ